VRPQHTRDDFYCGGFSSAVRPEEAHNFAGCHAEANVLNGWNGAKASIKVLEFKHHPLRLGLPGRHGLLSYPYVAFNIKACQVDGYIAKMRAWLLERVRTPSS